MPMISMPRLEETIVVDLCNTLADARRTRGARVDDGTAQRDRSLYEEDITPQLERTLGPPKALDEDETEFLDKLEMAACVWPRLLGHAASCLVAFMPWAACGHVEAPNHRLGISMPITLALPRATLEHSDGHTTTCEMSRSHNLFYYLFNCSTQSIIVVSSQAAVASQSTIVHELKEAPPVPKVQLTLPTARVNSNQQRLLQKVIAGNCQDSLHHANITAMSYHPCQPLNPPEFDPRILEGSGNEKGNGRKQWKGKRDKRRCCERKRDGAGKGKWGGGGKGSRKGKGKTMWEKRSTVEKEQKLIGRKNPPARPSSMIIKVKPQAKKAKTDMAKLEESLDVVKPPHVDPEKPLNLVKIPNDGCGQSHVIGNNALVSYSVESDDDD
ncbi:hypothetical protein TEA_022554 [Camellia sinensis var. sinensis]|uniref:Uncharacterized protein n=1 Tax=Camellia sinensis var. sinensis TaxID=542762 RepID=A0A4S4EZI6_CAMSN|nr:hypothetical protein TEA_022554 [Camellia sinensis var. sinensis]